MPAATTTTRREAARRATRRARGRATRERLHSIAWAAHEAGERPAPRELARRAGVAVQTMHRHALTLKEAGRWPWPNADGRWATGATGQGEREARARALVAEPGVAGVVRGAVTRAARVCPHLGDEAESHAWVALWEAAIAYADGHSLGWLQFLAIRLRNALVDARRGWLHVSDGRTRSSMLSLDGPATDGDDESPTIGETVPSDDLPVGWEVDSEDAAEALLAHAGGQWRVVLRAMYLECWEGRDELNARLGMSDFMVKNNRWKGMKMIRDAVADGSEAGGDG